MSRFSVCNKCDCRFDDPPSLEPSSCPQCGSDDITTHLLFSDSISLDMKDRLEAKVLDQSLPRKKRVRKELIVGADKRRSDGEWMDKERVIDRDNDHYKEKVVDPRSGETIHYCEEKLTDHFGHGSAKTPKT